MQWQLSTQLDQIRHLTHLKHQEIEQLQQLQLQLEGQQQAQDARPPFAPPPPPHMPHPQGVYDGMAPPPPHAPPPPPPDGFPPPFPPHAPAGRSPPAPYPPFVDPGPFPAYAPGHAPRDMPMDPGSAPLAPPDAGLPGTPYLHNSPGHPLEPRLAIPEPPWSSPSAFTTPVKPEQVVASDYGGPPAAGRPGAVAPRGRWTPGAGDASPPDGGTCAMDAVFPAIDWVMWGKGGPAVPPSLQSPPPARGPAGGGNDTSAAVRPVGEDKECDLDLSKITDESLEVLDPLWPWPMPKHPHSPPWR